MPTTIRTGFIITLLAICHLLLVAPLVTSQLQPTPGTLATAAKPSQEITIHAKEQEKQGTLYKLRGDVEIDFRTYVLHADDVTYDSATGESTETGHVRLDGGYHDTHLIADHGTYNINTDTGRFYEVSGTIGMQFRGKNIFLTSSNPFFFTGKMVEKNGPDNYVVNDGEVTSCEMPDPKWTFKSQRAVVVVGDRAVMYHSTFRIRGFPVMYFPYATHPVERLPRQSGFLMPHFGQSSVKGTILGEAFYWAINRSYDALIGAEYYSKRGWAQHGLFRGRPSETSDILLTYFGVMDRGLNGAQQGGQEARLNAQGFFHGYRAVANIDYLSSYVFRLAFSEFFAEAVNSEVRSVAFLSKDYRGYSFNFLASRYINFQSTTPADSIKIQHLPSFESGTVERQVGSSPLHWSYDFAAEGLSRHEPDFRTPDFVGRVDAHPRASLPLLLQGWSFRPEIAFRETYYTERLLPATGVGVAFGDPVSRKDVEGSFELRPPAVSRVFRRQFFGRSFKHSIEPRFLYEYVTGVNNFARVIRFDARDIISNTNNAQYDIVNRIYAKRRKPCTADERERWEQERQRLIVRKLKVPAGSNPCEDQTTRELLKWEIAQQYYIDRGFGNALVAGKRNVFSTTEELTGIAFLTQARRWSPIVSRLRVFLNNNVDAQWNLDYDARAGTINSSWASVYYRFHDYFLGGGHAYLQEPGSLVAVTSGSSSSSGVVSLASTAGASKFNQFRVLVGYGHPDKRGISGAAAIGYDANNNFLQYSAVQGGYNWDCCGISFEYRRFALGAVRNENQYRFSFSLSNVGTFGTIRPQERLY